MQMIFFVGAVQTKDKRYFRARVRLGDGSHRKSRKRFTDMSAALNWGNRWVRRVRRMVEPRLFFGGQA